mmetsp:Transcript_14912/g.25878  ORF Transcript_14912/g.25878 Transcript_14912/m.25878 type:complete len:209 (-) Transcript_14912:465-1091(-)
MDTPAFVLPCSLQSCNLQARSSIHTAVCKTTPAKQSLVMTIPTTHAIPFKKWAAAVAMAAMLATHPVASLAQESFDHQTLMGADFSSQNLESAIFVKVNCQGCKFVNANLSKATLENGNFQEAIMDNVNMSQTFCANTKFQGASMRNAIFTEANLIGAVFDANTILDSADFTDALVEPFVQKRLCKKLTGTNSVTGVSTRESLMCPEE